MKMGKERVTYSCGHTGVVNLYGPHDARDSKVAWMEREGLCPDCYRAQQAAAAADEVSRWEVNVPGLATLEGTDKQVQWARRIRYDRLRYAIGGHGLKPVCYAPNWEAEFRAQDNGTVDKCRRRIVAIRGIVLPLLSERSAKTWIDNRDAININAGVIMREWSRLMEMADKARAIRDRKPQRPDVVRRLFSEPGSSKGFNGRVYPVRGGYKIYLNGNEIILTTDDGLALKDYLRAYETWRAEREALQSKYRGELDLDLAVALADVPDEPVPASEPATLPEPIAYDKPMTAPVTTDAKARANATRRAVCLQALVLIRQGVGRSDAFRGAWEKIKEKEEENK
jgi:hypothetical protein